MVLEVVVSAGCSLVVTHNLRDFRGIDRFGVSAITPQTFLKKIGE